jgi:ATP-binding cassette subfamily C protein
MATATANAAVRAIHLGEEPAAFRVEAGEALLFRVDTETDGATGPRRFLVSVPAGTTVCHPGEPGLLLVPGPGCIVQPVPFESVSTEELDAWIIRLEGLFADELPPGPPRPLPSATESPDVGTVLTGPAGVVRWVRVVEGSLGPLCSEKHALAPASDTVPVTESTWLTVLTAPLRVEQRATADVPWVERLAGLRALVRLVLAWSRVKEEIEREALSRRAVRRDEQLQRETAQAVGRLAQLIESRPIPLPPGDELHTALAAVGQVLGITFKPAPDNAPGDPVEAIARASRVRFRRLVLSGAWWRDDLGPILAFIAESPGDASPRPVALLRGKAGYELIDPRQHRAVALTPELAAKITPRGYQFFTPFPARTLSLWELPPLALRPFTRELLLTGVLTLASTLLGLALPIVSGRIVDMAIPQASQSLLVQLGILLLATYFGQALFNLAQGYVSQRFYAGSTLLLQAATWDRLLHLGLSFFQRFSSGDLLKRVMLVTEVSQHISATMMRSFLSGLLSLLYLGVLLSFSVSLSGVAVVLAVLSAIVTVVLALAIRRQALPLTLIEGKNFGFVVQLIHGVAKLRVAGAEQRAFNRWAGRYEEQLKHTARIRFLEDVDHLILFLLPLLGSLVLYALAVPLVLTPGPTGQTALTLGGLVAFFATYGMFTEGLSAVSTTIVDVTDILARQVLLKPILDTEPETLRAKSDPGVLQGQIAVNRVSFRYTPTGPLVLDDVSLDAKPGEFIAIVGPSGSGKSTLVRLLLGFEPPLSGQVLIDGQNLGGLDLQSVRKQMGTVLQSSYLFSGPLFENIAAGNLVGQEEVMAAVYEAGLAEEVERLPMKLHTVISEGGYNLSGGQRQRVLLARALVTLPRILILDEATSALDNRTQALVSENLARRHVTRIVIAHRLSTIQRADRIYVLDKGKMVQSGTFAELMAVDGLFRRLMERQMA